MTNTIRFAAIILFASATFASAGPIATANASGGATVVITPAPAPAPVPSGFIHGYMSSFGR